MRSKFSRFEKKIIKSFFRFCQKAHTVGFQCLLVFYSLACLLSVLIFTLNKLHLICHHPFFHFFPLFFTAKYCTRILQNIIGHFTPFFYTSVSVVFDVNLYPLNDEKCHAFFLCVTAISTRHCMLFVTPVKRQFQ